MPPTARIESLFSHQTRHSLPGAGDALLPQFRMNAWAAIHLPTGVVDFLNMLYELLVFPLMLTHRTLLPGIVAAQGHFKCLTEDADGIVLSIVFHDLVP